MYKITQRELLPGLSDNDKKRKCTSCKHKHLLGDRVMVRTLNPAGYKDYCPKCLRGRTTVNIVANEGRRDV